MSGEHAETNDSFIPIPKVNSAWKVLKKTKK